MAHPRGGEGRGGEEDVIAGNALPTLESEVWLLLALGTLISPRDALHLGVGPDLDAVVALEAVSVSGSFLSADVNKSWRTARASGRLKGSTGSQRLLLVRSISKRGCLS